VLGKEKAEKYGKRISSALSGKTVSKRKDKVDEPGGLNYEAKLLGMDTRICLKPWRVCVTQEQR